MRVVNTYTSLNGQIKLVKYHNKICTEGYDTIEKSHHAVHYTRGETMDKRHGLF